MKKCESYYQVFIIYYDGQEIPEMIQADEGLEVAESIALDLLYSSDERFEIIFWNDDVDKSFLCVSREISIKFNDVPVYIHYFS